MIDPSGDAQRCVTLAQTEYPACRNPCRINSVATGVVNLVVIPPISTEIAAFQGNIYIAAISTAC
jgi:hypothetical protein